MMQKKKLTPLILSAIFVLMLGLSYAAVPLYDLFCRVTGFGVGALSLGLTGNIIWNYIPILILGSLVGGYLGANFSIIKGSNFIKAVFEIVSLSVGKRRAAAGRRREFVVLGMVELG